MPEDDAVLDRSITIARKRLLPLLLLMYIVSVLDRTNVAFAKQALQSSRGVSEAAYALGAGLFFLTYAVFEVPSNLLLYKVGARIWLSRIMVVWGLVSAATMLVAGVKSFYCLRLLLGAAEAGFFPGVILYLTQWFPNRARGQMLGVFYFGAPLSFIVGSPVSGWLMGMPPALGLAGWQWMFLVEGMFAVAVGVAAFLVLQDKPADASWLPEAERHPLMKVLANEEAERRAQGPPSPLELLRSPRVYYFAVTYFFIQAGVYGVIFYLPTEVASILGTKVGLRVGLVSAIPWTVAIIATYCLSRLADRTNRRRLLASLGLVAAGCAILAVPVSAPGPALAALCIAASGYIAIQPLFWSVPTGYLSGPGAAAGLAMINSFGNLGGFLAPNVKVAAEAHLGSKMAGPAALAAITFVGALLLALMHDGVSRTRRQ